MRTILSIAMLFTVSGLLAGEGYKVGDKAADFKLKNVDGKWVSLSDFTQARGFVVVFTCNTCPYAKAYQDRFIALDKTYKAKGYPVIAINANDPAIEPGDSFEAMVTRYKEKGYTFPYLYDEKHEVVRLYGAVKTPHIYVLEKNDQQELIVKYTGAVDDNYQDASAVKQPYLENAIRALLTGNSPDPSSTKAVGCGVKQKSEAAKL